MLVFFLGWYDVFVFVFIFLGFFGLYIVFLFGSFNWSGIDLFFELLEFLVFVLFGDFCWIIWVIFFCFLKFVKVVILFFYKCFIILCFIILVDFENGFKIIIVRFLLIGLFCIFIILWVFIILYWVVKSLVSFIIFFICFI